MQELISFYTQEIHKYKSKLTKIKKQLYASSMLRLFVFCMAALSIYLLYGNTKYIVAVVLITVIVFLYLVTRHSNLQKQRNKLKALIAINETEIQVQERKFHHLPDGKEYKNPLHHYSQDIDLFGRGSFYQYCNRTALMHGSNTLADLFNENNIDNITEKQEAIKELAAKPKWRQEYSAIASLSKTETQVEAIEKWLENYTPFMPEIMKHIPLVFSVLSLGMLVLYFMNVLPESSLIIWMFIGLGITGIFTRKITRLGANASKVQNTFEQYNKLLTIIENTEFKSVLLQKKKEEIISNHKKTSVVLHEFSRHLGALDQNNNIVYLVFGNGLFLRGLSTCYKIEKWIAMHGKSVEKWFHIIAFFDAYNSLGNFAFNHPQYAYPIIQDNGTVLKAKDAGHPLLHPKSTILNDINIEKEQFFIVTGANMAGKSTFLRTVSLQIVMANLGLPVCAKEVNYAPIKLITSMRTTDSLTDDESYFFSELKRLKFIVDQIQLDRYFIVLDEILKGTNSTDKATGSRKFIEKLVRSKSTGIIATHDLSLCESAKEFSQVKNYYFDAEIINNELHFDYTFKNGICKNMNASFLLKKMEIVD
ncbi:DNA mismatch repair protein MutS [uncultured Maribacter sp.]|uniref:MutS-related protein n=1 Tax=uncultured Maribacter sp. TaxID=431308 RepID=UPI002634482E|nr:DNA mismatch repair protein MutS [uncultured Maribacter sp.]